MSASSIWNVSETDFPVDGSPRQRLGFALKYAAQASGAKPNTQSWQFRLADAHLELLSLAAPELEASDPDGRERLIDCGAALHHLKLALKHFGCLGRVELFPDLAEPTLVARVHFGYSREREAREKFLFAAMNGARFVAPVETPVTEAVLFELSQAVANERGWLEFAQSEMSRQRVLQTTLAPATRAWGSDDSRANPAHSVGAVRISLWPRPLFAFGGRSVDSSNVALQPDPQISTPAATFGVVKTKTDDKHGWLAAGQILARAVLQAQVSGVSWAFFSPVRRREVREALRTGIGHKGFAQAVLRFGALVPREPLRLDSPTTATATFH